MTSYWLISKKNLGFEQSCVHSGVAHIPFQVHSRSGVYIVYSIPWSGMYATTCTPFHGVSVSGHTPDTFQCLNFPA